MRQLPPIILANAQLAPLLPTLGERYSITRIWEWDEELRHRYLNEARVIVVAGDAQLDCSLITRMPKLGLIACASAGYDGIDVAWVRRQGLQLSHAQGVNDEDVADHALGCAIVWRRSLLAGDATVRSGQWGRGSSLTNRSVRGLKLGIVGLGRVGTILATQGSMLGMDVRWWGPKNKPGGWPRMASLAMLAAESDVMVVTARADETNRGLVSTVVIDALGPEGYLVNVARGSLIDEDALIAALKSRRLGGAALDVFQQEPTDPERWQNVPNVLLTPHIAGKTSDAFRRIGGQLIANIDAFLAGQPILTPVCSR